MHAETQSEVFKPVSIKGKISQYKATQNLQYKSYGQMITSPSNTERSISNSLTLYLILPFRLF